jgi:hypothetical protein
MILMSAAGYTVWLHVRKDATYIQPAEIEKLSDTIG